LRKIVNKNERAYYDFIRKVRNPVKNSVKNSDNENSVNVSMKDSVKNSDNENVVNVSKKDSVKNISVKNSTQGKGEEYDNDNNENELFALLSAAHTFDIPMLVNLSALTIARTIVEIYEKERFDVGSFYGKADSLAAGENDFNEREKMRIFDRSGKPGRNEQDAMREVRRLLGVEDDFNDDLTDSYLEGLKTPRIVKTVYTRLEGGADAQFSEVDRTPEHTLAVAETIGQKQAIRKDMQRVEEMTEVRHGPFSIQKVEEAKEVAHPF
jgi:hypothetical protein